MTHCSKYLHVKLFEKQNTLCDTQQVCNAALINDCVMERRERWQSGEVEATGMGAQLRHTKEHGVSQEGQQGVV